MFLRLRPFFWRSLQNSLQVVAGFSSYVWKSKTCLCPVSVTSVATKRGPFSTLPSIRISRLTRPNILHHSTASINSLLAMLISVGDICRPISHSEIMERVRVLIPFGSKKLGARHVHQSEQISTNALFDIYRNHLKKAFQLLLDLFKNRTYGTLISTFTDASPSSYVFGEKSF
jgi:hypothetical protein